MKIIHETRLHCYNKRSNAENNFKRLILWAKAVTSVIITSYLLT